MKEAAFKWFKQAQHDLEMAEKNIEIDGYDVASFLAHQAGGVLGLADEAMENIAELSGDYMISRYPDVTGRVPYEEYDRNIAEEKVNAAKKIFEQLKDRYKFMEITDE